MRNLTVGLGLVLASAAIGRTPVVRVGAQAPAAPQGQQIFRAAVNLIETDVSVLDKNRRPVTGLTAADFTVFDNGEPKALAAFSAVDVSQAETRSTPSARTPRTVATAQSDDRRRVVILISDRQLDPQSGRACDGPGLASNEMASQLAHAVVDDLAPTDVAAVEYVYHRDLGQPFTTDHAKLNQAIDRFQPMVVLCETEATLNALIASGLPARDLVGALHETITELAMTPDRRKLMFVIDDGSDLEVGPSGRDQLYGAAARANVTLSTLDPDGLVGPGARLGRPGNADPHAAARETLVEMAHNMGGEPS